MLTDNWQQDEFENHVETALIALYETKVKKTRDQSPAMCGNKSDLEFIRKIGPYIPSNDRIIFCDENYSAYDIKNDGILKNGCYGDIIDKKINKINGYFDMSAFRKVDYLPKGWSRNTPGPLYQCLMIVVQNDGIYIRKSFYTLWNDRINGCDFLFHKKGRFHGHKLVTWREYELDNAKNCEFGASVAMQYTADSRFCWSIKAKESQAIVTLGCNQEEIKSLLYARSLPVTATGRKRPVLHLVEAHKRRLKNGIDIEVTAFLRGIPTIEMNGTLFTVIPPKVIAAELSKNSQQFY